MSHRAYPGTAARTRYHDGAVQILAGLRRDAEALAEVACRAVTALSSSHRVYANVTMGHMPKDELVNEREGNPGLFEFVAADACSPEQYAAMVPGDVLLTNHVGPGERAAREAGVFVAVATTCYAENGNAPAGVMGPNENGWLPEDVASQVIDSHVPWEQGLVRLPEVPEMVVLPSSAIGACAVHWAITAEVAGGLAAGAAPDGALARQYLDTLLQRLEEIHRGDSRAIARIGAAVAARLAGGGHLYVRSRNGGVRAEASRLAQGLVLTNAHQPRPAAEGGDGDVMVVAAVSPNDPEELAWAEAARACGNLVIGIGQPHNGELRDRCDAYLDDRCPEDAGVVPIPGRAEAVCPATGIVNNVILHLLTAEFVEQMCRRGAVPSFLMGGYRLAGQEYNEASEARFRRLGY